MPISEMFYLGLYRFSCRFRVFMKALKPSRVVRSPLSAHPVTHVCCRLGLT